MVSTVTWAPSADGLTLMPRSSSVNAPRTAVSGRLVVVAGEQNGVDLVFDTKIALYASQRNEDCPQLCLLRPAARTRRAARA